jgi:hypothetical protein
VKSGLVIACKLTTSLSRAMDWGRNTYLEH